MRAPPLARAACAGLLASCAVVPHATPERATPQRPTLSSDTSTTARGTFEVEAGLALDPGDAFSAPATLKYGSGPRTEVSLGWSPIVWAEVPGEDEVGIGDLVAGIRHRFHEGGDDRPSGAVQASVKLPTAREEEGLGTGEVDAGFAGIVSHTAGTIGATGFYQLDVLGEPAGGARIGHRLALAAGLPLGDALGAFTELSGVFVPEADSEIGGLQAGLTFQPSPWLVLDASVVVGIGRDAPDLLLLVGLTRNLGRLLRAASDEPVTRRRR